MDASDSIYVELHQSDVTVAGLRDVQWLIEANDKSH